METGTIIRSENFNKNSYWVVKCDNKNIPGNRNGELPIDPTTMPDEWVSLMGRFIHQPLLGRKIKFEVHEIGNSCPISYAKII